MKWWCDYKVSEQLLY